MINNNLCNRNATLPAEVLSADAINFHYCRDYVLIFAINLPFVLGYEYFLNINVPITQQFKN